MFRNTPTGEPPPGPLPPRFLVPLALLFEGGLALLAWLLGWALNGTPSVGLRWDAADALFGLAATLPMLAGLGASIRWPLGPLAQIKEVSDDFIRPLFAACSVADLALISLVAGVGEELLLRGFLQALIQEHAGWVAGWFAASVVFGLLHFITPAYGAYAGLMGLYLGGVWLGSGNLLVAVIAHALYDFLALVYVVRRPPRLQAGGPW